jgi:hypothetical protein
MGETLDRLLNNHTVALIGAPVLILIIAAILIRNWRAVRRGDPLKSAYPGLTRSPGDFWYWIYLIRLQGVTGAFVFVVLPIALLVFIAMVMAYFRH